MVKATGSNVALTYTILKGDTFSGLARAFSQAAGVTWQEILNDNLNLQPKYVHAGQVINIPAFGGGKTVLRYSVLQGDTLYGISLKLAECKGLSVADIQAANPSIEPTKLKINAIILIPSTTESSTVALQAQDVPSIEIEGLYKWSWIPPAVSSGANLDVAFSGYVDPDQAIENCHNIYSVLRGEKYISLGGGNDNGSWRCARITAIISAIKDNKFSAYEGIAFDIEVGDTGLSSDFSKMFSAAKQQGMKVLVTVSHSAPYGFSDAATLMSGFFADKNIDFMSPQLYTTGHETENDYAVSGGVKWSDYARSEAAVIVSIVKREYYNAESKDHPYATNALAYFKSNGVQLKGYIQWA